STTVGLSALLLGALAIAACGGGSGLTDQSPPEDPPVDPGPEPPAPEVEGYAIYAVTLDNRLLLLGSENPTTIASSVNITGLPVLSRIVGIDFRPSTGELYGIGTDSRVYRLDRRTGAATAVSPVTFEPKIASFFDIHFAMGFEPPTERIRLISAESRMNWSIDPDDGTAVRGMDAHYAAGDPNEGRRPAIVGLAYTQPSAGMASARQAPPDLCEDLMWAIDAELAELIGSCDPDEGDFTSLGPLPGILALAGCGEIKFDPEGNLFASLLWSAKQGSDLLNSLFTIDPETGLPTWRGDIPVDSPIQAIAFDPDAPFSPVVRHASAAARQAGTGNLRPCTGGS
ncbi:MAG: DUF4394 domain-containing protein, partial [Actinomycetota bacterium]